MGATTSLRQDSLFLRQRLRIAASKRPAQRCNRPATISTIVYCMQCWCRLKPFVDRSNLKLNCSTDFPMGRRRFSHCFPCRCHRAVPTTLPGYTLTPINPNAPTSELGRWLLPSCPLSLICIYNRFAFTEGFVASFGLQRLAMKTVKNTKTYDVIVVGGGAAGIGVSIALKHAGVENFLVLDRYYVGASFSAWPDETRFITPSFPSNSIGMLDLNSIAIGISPAYSLQVEHPTGAEYAVHLQSIAEHFKLPVREDTNVMRVTKVGDDFRVDTTEDTLRARHVIWAAGEFQYPHLNVFAGSELCQHTAMVASYEELEGDEFIIVGGYESGVDAAYHLAYLDKRVQLFDRGCPWLEEDRSHFSTSTS